MITLSPSTPFPEIDPEIISAYCRIVFQYVEGNVPVRILAETGTSQQTPQQIFSEVAQLTSVLCARAPKAADEDCGVYVVPCSVGSARSARAHNMLQTRVILIDLDKGEIAAKRAHAVRHIGKPSLEIASGGITEAGEVKRHLYWSLTEVAEGSDLERVRALRETLAIKLGGDPSFKSLAQPIRVAGTVHGKHGVKAPVRILAKSDFEYDLSELEEASSEMPALEAAHTGTETGQSSKHGSTATDLTTRLIRADGVDSVTRFEALSKVIGHWIRSARRQACTLDDAWCAIRDHNAAMIAPPWDEARLRREFHALMRRDVQHNGPMPPAPREEEQQGRAPDNSEDAIAARFADCHGSDWKHVAHWGNWFRWTGQVWSRDDTGTVRELARMICRVVASDCERLGEARRIASDRTIMACLRIAASDPRLSAATSDWDTRPMLLNTPTGIVDLETGEVRPHDPALMLTQMTTASAAGDCPMWRAFLGQITGGNSELEAYLQRLAGYCLTGSTREQSFAFLHGDGANGKSVFLSTIAHVLGDYAATATLDTFMSVRGTRHLTELAGLRAARLVLVSETEQNHSWAEARIKTVTGGEKIRANFMRQDHFEFTPQFKLVIAGNHRPHLSGFGEAMRRRLHLVPFDVTIPANRRDPRLTEKLKAERDGILRWMLDGCADWQRVGLAPPDCVLEAAKEYFDEEDLVGQWVAERCNVGSQFCAPSKELFSSWTAWAEENGCRPDSVKALGAALRQRGYRQAFVNRARGWSGLCLRQANFNDGGGE